MENNEKTIQPGLRFTIDGNVWEVIKPFVASGEAWICEARSPLPYDTQWFPSDEIEEALM